MEKTERKTDLRVLRTRTSIQKVFKEMICEMDADQITIKELTDRAMIHRKTFYLHYTSIEALYGDVLNDVLKEYSDLLAELPVPFTPMDNVRIFFEYFSKQDKFMERLLCNSSYREFCNQFFAKMMLYNKERYNPFEEYSAEEYNIITIYLSSSILDMYRQWIYDKKKIPVDRMIDLAGTLITDGFNALVSIH